LVAGLLFFGISAVRSIKIDIFPKLDLPVIYISHPYGGFTPDQMETYFAKGYVNLLLYVGGVKSIETRNIQGLTLLKLTFYEGTDMAAGGFGSDGVYHQGAEFVPTRVAAAVHITF
jgi:multidrug efflux pump subunit AcrB